MIKLSDVSTVVVRVAPDGDSLLYAVEAEKRIIIYRAKFRDGRIIGTPEVALTVPFAFTFMLGGNAYDFSRDLTTVLFAKPDQKADLYRLSYEP